MMKPVRFIEKETGTEVLVSTPLTWGDEEKVSIVRYPNGAEYHILDRKVSTHFEMVRPQEVFITAFGTNERPTKHQRALDAEAERATEPGALALTAQIAALDA